MNLSNPILISEFLIDTLFVELNFISVTKYSDHKYIWFKTTVTKYRNRGD